MVSVVIHVEDSTVRIVYFLRSDTVDAQPPRCVILVIECVTGNGIISYQVSGEVLRKLYQYVM